MNIGHLPWLELSILIPLCGSLWIARFNDADLARRYCLWFSGLALGCAVLAWCDFVALGDASVGKGLSLNTLVGRHVLAVDQLSAPLFSLAAAIHFLTVLATLRVKIRRFSFAGSLFSEAVLLAIFSIQSDCGISHWGMVILFALSLLPPAFELRVRGNPRQIYLLYMSAFIGLLAAGVYGLDLTRSQPDPPHWPLALITLAVFIRNGVLPFQTWMRDMVENASFGTTIQFLAPLPAAYAFAKLVLPDAPHDWLIAIAIVSLATAVYAAGMSLVQKDARRFFCYLFLSHSSLVLVGLTSESPLSLTGALVVWLSVGMSLGALGLTLRALEARFGRLSLTRYQGLYDHMPLLATFFVLTGLASVGFPGTFGFIGTELLVDGAVEAYPLMGITVVFAGALNGIALLRTFFLLFTGTNYVSSVSITVRRREKFAIIAVAALILIGGLFPQPNLESRYEAAEAILLKRGINPAVVEAEHGHAHGPEHEGPEPNGTEPHRSHSDKVPPVKKSDDDDDRDEEKPNMSDQD